MKKTVIALLVSFIGAYSFAGTDIDFDQAVDTAKIIQDADNSVIADLSGTKPRYTGRTWYTRDCARFDFGPETPSDSDTAWLDSQEWIEECDIVQVPVYNNTGHIVGYHPETRCRQRQGYMHYNRSVRLSIGRRTLLPWEKETFDVCLEGSWMNLQPLSNAYEYSIAETGGYNTQYTLTPVRKIPASPDPAGIAL